MNCLSIHDHFNILPRINFSINILPRTSVYYVLQPNHIQLVISTIAIMDAFNQFFQLEMAFLEHSSREQRAERKTDTCNGSRDLYNKRTHTSV